MNSQKLVVLKNEKIQNLISEHLSSLREISEVDPQLDLSREFRFKNYPILILILENALQELISTKIPNPETESEEEKENGFLYLYDGRTPNYMEDNISWKKTKMSVKVVVYNKDKRLYKLKNHKTDRGIPVMRRQTWQSEQWRKNEYKLIKKETFYKSEEDGTFSVSEHSTLKDVPVLVHYFRKGSDSSKGTGKRKTSIESSDIFGFSNENPDIKVEENWMDLDLEPVLSEANDFFSKIIPSQPFRIVAPNASFEIKSYAPDVGPQDENTKVILVLNQENFNLKENNTYYFSVMLDGKEIPATSIAPGVIEFFTPPHTSGISYFWLMCKEKGKKTVHFSNTVPFFFTPNETGRLSLSQCNLTVESSTMIRKFRHAVRELDLSFNKLTDVHFLSEFHQLRILILDNNYISSFSKLPFLPKLDVLYVNCNLITELEPFVESLSLNFPSLQYLSLLGNEACPRFTKEHYYYNYRIYVISKLRKLTHLDSSLVSPEERKHSLSIIPSEEVEEKQEEEPLKAEILFTDIDPTNFFFS